MADGHQHKARNPAERNIGTIAALEHASRHRRSAGDRLSDAVARATGSVPFALIHLALFVTWIVVNTGTFFNSSFAMAVRRENVRTKRAFGGWHAL
jgi:uncharacterized membrane protein